MRNVLKGLSGGSGRSLETKFFYSPLIKVGSDDYHKMVETCFVKSGEDNQKLGGLIISIRPIFRFRFELLKMFRGYDEI